MLPLLESGTVTGCYVLKLLKVNNRWRGTRKREEEKLEKGEGRNERERERER